MSLESHNPSSECVSSEAKDPCASRFLTKIERLRDRAACLQRSRSFFETRGVLEVDCPAFSQAAPIDLHIDLISARYLGKEPIFLHSSPEFGMKRLLSEGMGDIYQLSHVFREGEWSCKHNPEFMMAEWYRQGFSLEQMIEETLDFIHLFLGKIPSYRLSYREAFLRYAQIDYLKLSDDELFAYIQKERLSFYPSLLEEGKDALLNLILGSKIEPLLGNKSLCVLTHYPASQAALAKKITLGEEEVAERFEIYYEGVELANGYHELTDAEEQRKRFVAANQARVKLGKNPLPIDENFLKALEKGLPHCCGVAVGFDRLMMLRQSQDNIAEVIPFGWNQA